MDSSMPCIDENKQAEVFPPVVDVNVGGQIFTTALSTLLRFPDSFLSAMFSGRHPISRDREGRPYIDYEPEPFRHVLQYLRMQTLPPVVDSLQVFEAATYFGVEPLRMQLMSVAPVAKALVKAAYWDRYKGLRQRIIKVAVDKATASASYQSVVRVAITGAMCSPGHQHQDPDCIRNADIESELYLTWDGDESPASALYDPVKHDQNLRCVRSQLVDDGYVVATVSRTYKDICRAAVENFEFTF